MCKVIECHEQLIIKSENRQLFLNHYPLRTWWHKERKVIMLYGHVHGRYFEEDLQTDELTLDVGVDVHNFKPWSLKEIVGFLDKKIQSHASGTRR